MKNSQGSNDANRPWREQGLRYFPQSLYFRQTFGQKVWKVSVDAGFGCPNIDGSVATDGCIFCNARAFSPGRRLDIASISRQIDEGLKRISRRYNVDQLIAYFQPSTNTYAPVEQLREAYGEALAHPNVVGLAVGTRPDCISDEALDLLREIGETTWLQVELGIQTIHDRSLDWLQRGHAASDGFDAMARCAARGIPFGAHLILGIPGETRADIQATANALAVAGVHSVKLHNLYVVRDTRLADQWRAGELRLPTLPEYAAMVVDFLERMPEGCVVDRVSGDVPPPYFLGPEWAKQKHAIRAAIEEEFVRRDTRQGKCADAT